jgi:VCBS repeat-containing protein
MFTAHPHQPDQVRAVAATGRGAGARRRAWRVGGLSGAAVLVALVALALPAAAPAQVSFGGATNLPTGGHYPRTVAVGDFDGDSDPDLAVANQGSTIEGSANVSVRLGRAGGSFAAPTALPTGFAPFSVAVGKLTGGGINGDSDPDLAVANFGSNDVSVLTGGEGGSFGAAENLTAGTNPTSVAVGGFDGDPGADLAVANGGSDDVKVIPFGLFGGFSETFPTGGDLPRSVAVGEFDGNSDPDLAVANQDSHNVSLLLGGPGSSFVAAAKSPISTDGQKPSSVAVDDFNGDSHHDLAVTNVGSGDVSVLLGDGAGNFAKPTRFPTGGTDPTWVAVDDFNGDSELDLAIANYSGNVSVLLGDGAGSFGAPTSFPTGQGSWSVAVGDFDGDSDPDLAVANFDSHNVSVLLNTSDHPRAAADAYATGEDEALTVNSPGVLANDTDSDGDTLTAMLESGGPENGKLTLNPDGSFSYTPDPDFNGQDSFSYRADDGNHDSEPVTVTIDVKAVQDAPVAEAEGYELFEDDWLSVAAPGVLANDSDAEGDSLTAVEVSGPTHGSLTFWEDGSFIYQPFPDYSGPDSFRYQVSGGGLDSQPVTVTLDVKALNDRPVASNDFYEIGEDTPLDIAPAGLLDNDSDIDGDSLTPELVSGPQHGRLLEFGTDGSFRYLPHVDYSGSDNFSYRVRDPDGWDSDAVTVGLYVHARNDAPRAGADAYTTDEDDPLSVEAPGVLANDSDPEGDAFTAALVVGPAHGRLELGEDGSFAYMPDPDYNGTDSFSYRASGGDLDSDPVTVTIDVGPVDDPSPAGSAPPPPGSTPPPGGPTSGPAAPTEPAISALRIRPRCARPSAAGRVRIRMSLRMTQVLPLQLRIERAVRARAGRGCASSAHIKGRYRRVATLRRLATRPATAGRRKLTLKRRLTPGLYRLTVHAQFDHNRLSRPARGYLRVLG